MLREAYSLRPDASPLRRPRSSSRTPGRPSPTDSVPAREFRWGDFDYATRPAGDRPHPRPRPAASHAPHPALPLGLALLLFVAGEAVSAASPFVVATGRAVGGFCLLLGRSGATLLTRGRSGRSSVPTRSSAGRRSAAKPSTTRRPSAGAEADRPRPRRRVSQPLPASYAMLAVLLVALLGVAVISALSSPQPAASAPAAMPAVSTPAAGAPQIVVAPCVPPPPYSTDLGAVVEAEVAPHAGTYGVAVLNLDSGEAYLRNADQRYPAASIYKLGILYEAWRQISSGALSPSTKVTITPEDAVEPEPAGGPVLGATLTVTQALDAMVTVSSNASARALLRILGRDSVNGSMAALGLRDTVLPAAGLSSGVVDSDGTELAATSPRDALCFMSLLARDRLIGASASGEMRGTLLRQRINDRLPALLPPDARVAHKTGELSDVRNDVGIVYTSRGSWAVAVLSKDVDGGEATSTIARLSRRLYDYFTRS